MNRIFKVIWSKTKHCYIVVSEYAKANTKAVHTGLRTTAAAAAVAAMLLAPVNYNYAWAADTATVTDTSTTPQTVYTKEGADKELAKKADQTALDATNANLAKKAEQTALDEINTNLAKKADQTALDATNANLVKKADQTALDATNASLAAKANADDVYSKTEADGKFAAKTDLAAKANAADVYSKDGADDTFATKESLGKETTARETADTNLNTRITNVKEYLENQTSENYVSKADAAVQDAGVVKADKKIGENVTALGKGLYDETAARIGADAAQDKVIQKVNENLVQSVNTINKNVADGFTALNTADANEAKARTDADAAEKAAREVGDTTLDTRITKVKEYLENQTSENYVSKTDAAVQDGAIVKADKTIGENVTNLDAALAKETAARIGADKAQDKVIETVNQNMVDGFNTINTNMANGFAALNQADANEAKARADADAAEQAARIGADAKLAEAVNSSISLSADNVLHKNTTNVDANGIVTTGKADVTEVILNKGGDNQITLSDKGVKVGTNSSVMDKDGVYTGGDTYSDAKAALKSNGSIKGADGDFTVDGTTGNVSTKGSLTAASGKIGNVSMSADGTATMSNGSLNGINQINATGNIVTTGNMKAHDITAEGTIKGETINAATGTFSGAVSAGSLNVTNKLTAGNIESTGSIEAKGNLKGDSLTVANNASVGGQLSAGTLTAAGNKFTVEASGNVVAAGVDAGAGTIQTTGVVETGTLHATRTATVDGNAEIKGTLKAGDTTVKSLDAGSGTIQTTGTVKAGDVQTGTLKTTDKAEIGGNLTVDKNLTVNGTFDSKILSSKLDENNYTTITGGNVTSKNSKVSVSGGRTYTSTSNLTEKGRRDTAADGTTRNVSAMTAVESDSTISSLADANQKSYVTQNLKKILQGIKNGTNESIINQIETGIKSTATDGKNTASTNLSNKGFNTYATDGTNKTYTLQTAESLTSQIGDDGKVKSVMNVDGITNNADGGTITNSAKDLVNTATGDMTNTVGGKLLNDVTDDMENKVGGNLTTTVTGKVTEDFKSDLTTTIGGNKSEDVKGTSTETVIGKKTENYNGGLETTVTGEEKHTVNGSQTNAITGNQTNTIGGSQTTTVTGDSSLTAENINNTAKNKITNKALDVETDAASSIVSKVSNDYGSNTSTQTSNETKEAMSQADGKTASYLRGAAEEKSQLIDSSKKTTIDTIAGQTNTNITDGTNTSNDLQKADQIASSVTDGTNTTVVNQNAKSLASSITDGTKANNTNSTVDKSEQLIKASDTQYSATTKTATKMEDALVSGSSFIDVIKNLDDAAKPFIGSAVTDGTNSTGVTQTAKDITNTAEKGTIANNAKDIINNATENMTTTVGGEMKTTVTGKVTEDYKSDLDTKVGGKQTTTVTGDSSLTAKNINNKATKALTNEAETITNKASESVTTQIGDGTAVKSEMTADGITNTAEGGTIYNKSKDILNEVSGDILNFADGEIGNAATKITNLTGDNTVTSDTNGTTFENKAHSTAVKKGTITKTTISGNTITTGEAVMDYADVMKDLGVRGNAAVDGNTTLGKEGEETTLTVNSTSTFKKDVTMKENATVGKDLTVNGKSTLIDDVTMESNATVKKNLTVNGQSTFNDKVIINNGGLEVTGGTQTDTLHVTGASNFDGVATFENIVTMKKSLSVGGNATVTGDVTAKSYKVGDKTYIDANGINANGQKITNVAAGTEDSDAANYGQLRKVETRVDGVENCVTNVENRVDKMDSRIDKVGANAAAMANLHPLEFDEDSKWNVAAAVGNYKGETATAVGAFYRPNEDVMFNLSTTFGNDENMVGGGLSLRLGKGGNREKDKKLKAAIVENNDLRAKVDDLTARMDALLSVINPNMSKEFPDVPENHWAYEAVTRLAGNDIVQGYEDGKFHGERTMTRYEMAELIYNALSRGAKAEKKLVEEFKPELQAMAAQKQAK